MSGKKTVVEKRRDDALRRALSTPPKPKQEPAKGKDKPKKEKPAKCRHHLTCVVIAVGMGKSAGAFMQPQTLLVESVPEIKVH